MIETETTKAAKRLFPLMCLLLVSCSQGPQEQIGSRDQALGETPQLAAGAIDDYLRYKMRKLGIPFRKYQRLR